MRPNSCVPPSFPEPLLPLGPDTRAEAAERDARRMIEPEGLMSRLVYDSLVPPDRPALPCPGTTSAAGMRRTSSSSDGTGSGSGGGGVHGGGGGGGGSFLSGGGSCPGKFNYATGLEAWYLPESFDDTTLVFESRFECGNLRRAIQVGRLMQIRVGFCKC